MEIIYEDSKKRSQENSDSPNEDLTVLSEHLYNKDVDSICGLDEAGRGALAGPLVVAAVIFPTNLELGRVDELKD